MFKDRKGAGQKLGEAFDIYKKCNGVVLAIAKDGTEAGFCCSICLDIPLLIVVVHKLPFSENPEAGFGAIAEDDSTFFADSVSNRLSSDIIKRIVSKQKQELERRTQVLIEGKPLLFIKDKIVILVGDGIAWNATMQSAIMLCINKKAVEIVAASLVANQTIAEELAKAADEIVILEKPLSFHALAEIYNKWYDVPDSEAIGIMKNGRYCLSYQ